MLVEVKEDFWRRNEAKFLNFMIVNKCAIDLEIWIVISYGQKLI